MRKILSVLVLLLSLAGGSVFGYQVVAQNTPTVTHGSKAAYTMAEYDWSFFDVWQYEQKQPIYFFINSYFMGKYEDGDWYSMNDFGEWYSMNDLSECEDTIFYLKDLVVVPSFNVYSMKRFLGKVDAIGWDWPDQLELDWYNNKHRAKQEEALNSMMDRSAEGFFRKDGTNYVKLPNRIWDREVRNLALYDYNSSWSRHGNIKWDDLDEDESTLTTNAKHDPRPKSFKRDKELSEDYRQYFLELLRREGMAGASLVIWDHCQCDVDDDGEDEHIIIVQNTMEDMAFFKAERGKKNYGMYSYVFYADGERIQEVYKNTMLCAGSEKVISYDIDVTSLSYLPPLLGVYDLNNDGKLECCLDLVGYEGGSVAVYALDDNNEYNMVLCSNYGM